MFSVFRFLQRFWGAQCANFWFFRFWQRARPRLTNMLCCACPPPPKHQNTPVFNTFTPNASFRLGGMIVCGHMQNTKRTLVVARTRVGWWWWSGVGGRGSGVDGGGGGGGGGFDGRWGLRCVLRSDYVCTRGVAHELPHVPHTCHHHHYGVWPLHPGLNHRLCNSRPWSSYRAVRTGHQTIRLPHGDGAVWAVAANIAALRLICSPLAPRRGWSRDCIIPPRQS